MGPSQPTVWHHWEEPHYKQWGIDVLWGIVRETTKPIGQLGCVLHVDRLRPLGLSGPHDDQSKPSPIGP